MRTAFTWLTLIAAALVVLGVFAQVYLIGAWAFGGGADPLDAHRVVGGITHNVEILTFLLAIGAFWGRWAALAIAFSLPVVGTIQLSLSQGDEWVGALHALLALFVLVIAAAVIHLAMGALRGGRRRSGDSHVGRPATGP